MSLLRMGGGHSLGLGLGIAIKDQGENPKVGQCGAPQGQLPCPLGSSSLQAFSACHVGDFRV